jgi:hypothetical protein
VRFPQSFFQHCIEILNEIWREKNPNCASRGVTFRAKFHSKSLYSVEKKIVGISQYAYFSQVDRFIFCLYGGTFWFVPGRSTLLLVCTWPGTLFSVWPGTMQ